MGQLIAKELAGYTKHGTLIHFLDQIRRHLQRVKDAEVFHGCLPGRALPAPKTPPPTVQPKAKDLRQFPIKEKKIYRFRWRNGIMRKRGGAAKFPQKRFYRREKRMTITVRKITIEISRGSPSKISQLFPDLFPLDAREPK